MRTPHSFICCLATVTPLRFLQPAVSDFILLSSAGLCAGNFRTGKTNWLFPSWLLLLHALTGFWCGLDILREHCSRPECYAILTHNPPSTEETNHTGALLLESQKGLEFCRNFLVKSETSFLLSSYSSAAKSRFKFLTSLQLISFMLGGAGLSGK